MITALILSATLMAAPTAPVKQVEQLESYHEAFGQCADEMKRQSISRAKEACNIALVWSTVADESTQKERSALADAVHFINTRKDELPTIGWTQ